MVASSIAGSGADRIDHGLNAADKPELMEIIKSRDLGMTLCPHAYNRRLSVEEVFPKIRKLFDAGIKGMYLQEFPVQTRRDSNARVAYLLNIQ